MKYLLVFLVFISFSISDLLSQKGVTAFGVQVKPIFPLGIVNTDGQIARDENNGSLLTIDVNSGYSLGAAIRIGITDRFSFETGITYTSRNYSFNLESPDFPASSADFRFPGYEIPALAMVFVRLNENIFMNVSGGLSFDFFPTGGIVTYDRDTIEYGMLEGSWIQLALVANIGFEYRTENSGFFYLGASYHGPFTDVAEVYISSREPNTNQFTALVQPFPSVGGSYLSLDLRYYFNPEKKKSAKQ